VPPEEAAKSTKTFGKFFNLLGDIISDPRTRKALGATGIALDPNGVGGALGQLGIDFAEADAQAAFRRDIELGGNPNLVKTPGLSPEGRRSVIDEQLDIQQQATDARNRKFDEELRLINVSLAEERNRLSEERLEALETSNEQRAENEAAKREQDLIKIEIDRLKAEVDAAAKEASQKTNREKVEQDRINNEAKLRLERTQINTRRVKEIDSSISDLTDNLALARRRLDQAREAKGNSNKGPGQDKFNRAALEVARIETDLRQMRSERADIILDINSDLSGEPRERSQSSAQRNVEQLNEVGGIPIIRSAAGLNSVKDGQQFYAPDPQTGRPILMVKQGGKIVEVLR
jgi:hypothetical protein